jgi:hypothetical protein
METNGSPFKETAEGLEVHDIIDHSEVHEDIPLVLRIQNAESDHFQIVNDHILDMTTTIPTVPNAFDAANPNSKPKVISFMYIF